MLWKFAFALALVSSKRRVHVFCETPVAGTVFGVLYILYFAAAALTLGSG